MNSEPEYVDDEQTDSDDAVIGRALRGSLLVFSVLAILALLFVWLARPEPPEEPQEPQNLALPEVRATPEASRPTVAFTNITDASGIDFVHRNGATGEKLLPETMGGGCAFLDYDGDGDQDLLLINSSDWPWSPDPEAEPAEAALYANDGSGRFADVTEEAGLGVQCYGMGVAVGDYDNDGDPDVFVSAVGENQLYRNTEGVFEEVTGAAGVSGAADEWSTSCGWFDFDNDGDLDLLVGNYVQWSKDIDIAQDFRLTGIGRAYGPPFSFEGTFPYLYRNNGDGTFDDVSEESGLHQTNAATGAPLAKTLGLAPVDVDHDGWIDVVVANDTVRNLLFVNNRDGTFVESGIEAGLAFDATGKARGAMGIDSGCFRNDDCLGVAIANFANEMTALYVSAGKAPVFTDDAIPSGLGPPTRTDLAFGLLFLDVDLDGRLDLFTANGHLEEEINQVQSSQYYRQRPRLFWNAGSSEGDEFTELLPPEGSALQEPLVGRGAAFADIDGDGDLDVVVTQIGGKPALLRNDLQTSNRFLRVKLIGTKCNRDAIGAVVEVRSENQTVRRQVMPTRSYLSQAELPITIGLGPAADVDSLTIHWPDGSSQAVLEFELSGTTTVTQTP